MSTRMTALRFRPVAGLAKVQEPGGAGAQAEEEGGGERTGFALCVRRQTCAYGSFEWYVLNGHTRPRASGTLKTKAAAEARRGKAGAARSVQDKSPPANAEKVECSCRSLGPQ